MIVAVLRYHVPRSSTIANNSGLSYAPSATPYTSFESGFVSVSPQGLKVGPRAIAQQLSRFAPFIGNRRSGTPFGPLGDIIVFGEFGCTSFMEPVADTSLRSISSVRLHVLGIILTSLSSLAR